MRVLVISNLTELFSADEVCCFGEERDRFRIGELFMISITSGVADDKMFLTGDTEFRLFSVTGSVIVISLLVGTESLKDVLT